MSPWSELKVLQDPMTDAKWKVTECKLDDGHVVSLRIGGNPKRITFEIAQQQGRAGGFVGVLKVRVDHRDIREYPCDGDSVVVRNQRRIALSIGPSKDEPPQDLLYDLFDAADRVAIRYQREDDGDEIDVVLDAAGLQDFLRQFPGVWKERY